MPRLFIAAVLPEPARDRLLAVRPAILPGLRLVGLDEMHLTLHFLGEVDESKTAAVVRTLARVRAEPFAIAVQGVGRFPPEGEPQVLWAGVQPNPQLSGLHHAVATALAEAVGFRPEDRPYTPHITLARLNTSPTPGWAEEYLRQHASLWMPSVSVARFALLSSVLTPEGPRYRTEAAFDLSRAGPPVAERDDPRLHLVFLRDGRVLLTRKAYRDWREIQDEYDGYMASLGPWTVAEMIEYLESEHPGLGQAAERVRSFGLSDAEVLEL